MEMLWVFLVCTCGGCMAATMRMTQVMYCRYPYKGMQRIGTFLYPNRRDEDANIEGEQEEEERAEANSAA